MMKMNKKLLTRLFALLASLVLVLALAIPCFADDIESPPYDYVYKRVYSYEELVSYFNGDYGTVPAIIKLYVGFDSFELSNLEYYSSEGIAYVNWSFATSDGLYLCSLEVASSQPLLYNVTIIPSDGDSSFSSVECTWSDVEFYILVPDPSSVPSELGWFSQIKNIIKEAVFGQDAVLNDSQEFTINQISLWLTLIVILLPLIVGAVILVRCFR